ncbi:phosphoribosylaminoimidazolesuccinocarboxamide synthase [Jeotgalibacillus campisalis]|uniref:Phosphoribosylaminoimidazole-succinocarboxamide synthase n=1 Tax=Jeotgalibacillus campisalis TaxID=220754 RepID=A0A0C2VRE3_9BACL|nr:phosphoribosylaminoimidazolesuccinocarboxamide synthase [Jeotgalibacillus campisalis]KIL46996.1 phosphoribosylaminoimidazole-succinocarboxamide synthase [Jeotgalibacillus campisalis]
MEKGQMLYEGKAKRLYSTNEEGILWLEYKDSATAFNGEKKATIEGKGQLNNLITSLLFERLKEEGIDSHFIEKLSDHEQLVRHVEIIPIEVVVRNTAAGTLAKRIGLKEGLRLKHTIVEWYYKDDDLGDPLINEDHISLLGLAEPEELTLLKEKALEINRVLTQFFQQIEVDLIDFKLEFGRDKDGSILLADEISPDTCRLWDSKTKQKLDKDVFRRDLGSLTDAYQTVFTRLGGVSS